MSVLDMAKKYYPRLWSRERIEALVEAGRLTQEQADEVLGAGPNLDRAEGNGLEG